MHSDRKLQDLILVMGAMAIMTILYAVVDKNNNTKYIVKSKQDNKIIFEDIDSLHTVRVMNFNLDSVDTKLMHDYYEYINVGDTLQGKDMNIDTIMSPYLSNMQGWRVPAITKINGKWADSVIKSRRANSKQK